MWSAVALNQMNACPHSRSQVVVNCGRRCFRQQSRRCSRGHLNFFESLLKCRITFLLAPRLSSPFLILLGDTLQIIYHTALLHSPPQLAYISLKFLLYNPPCPQHSSRAFLEPLSTTRPFQQCKSFAFGPLVATINIEIQERHG